MDGQMVAHPAKQYHVAILDHPTLGSYSNKPPDTLAVKHGTYHYVLEQWIWHVTDTGRP